MLSFNLTLQYPSFTLATGLNTIPGAGITAIFGPSGCGKTTLIKALSGLEKARGDVSFNGTLWQNNQAFLPVHKRRIGMVFQDGALLPHLNVMGNLLYAANRSGASETEQQKWIELLELTDLLPQSVLTLSGGEQQRVALARALLSLPQILMLDEPMSALDWRSKNELIPVLKKVSMQSKLPMLIITHSPEEVERLADHVLLMNQGNVCGLSTLQQALAQSDSPLFDEQGAVSVLLGKPGDLIDGLQQIHLGSDSLWIKPMPHNNEATIRLRMPARDVSIALQNPEQISITNHLWVRIIDIITQPSGLLLIRLQLQDGQCLFSEIANASASRLNLEVGRQVYALIKSVAISE